MNASSCTRPARRSGIRPQHPQHADECLYGLCGGFAGGVVWLNRSSVGWRDFAADSPGPTSSSSVTRIPLQAVDGNFRIFIPGSLTDKRRQPHRTLGVLEIEHGHLTRAEIVTLP